MEKKIGSVTHWYDKIGVAVVKLSDTLTVGDKIKIQKGDDAFEETVSSLQINHADAVSAKSGDDAAIKLSRRAKEGADVLLLK